MSLPTIAIDSRMMRGRFRYGLFGYFVDLVDAALGPATSRRRWHDSRRNGLATRSVVGPVGRNLLNFREVHGVRREFSSLWYPNWYPTPAIYTASEAVRTCVKRFLPLRISWR